MTAGRRSVVVRLVDWCQCLRGQDRERIVDLSDDAFSVLDALPVGVIDVVIAPVVAPATDSE